MATGSAPLAVLDNTWKTTGNAGTTPALNFVGTTDSAPLDLRVNNTRAMRIESSAGTPNLIGGHSGNTIGSGSVGAVIAGGGASVFSHSIGAGSDYGSIGGGLFNSIASNSAAATIVGGALNAIASSSFYATIGGGHGNNIASSAPYASIPGGLANEIGTGASFAFAAGRQAKANHAGSFVWGDSQDGGVFSTTTNQVVFRAQNGMRLTEDAG